MSLTKTAYNHLKKPLTLGGYKDPEIWVDEVGVAYLTNGNVLIMTTEGEYEANTDKNLWELVKPQILHMNKTIALPTRKELKAEIDSKGIKYKGMKYQLAEGFFVDILYLYDAIVNTKATEGKWSGEVDCGLGGYYYAKGSLLIGNDKTTFVILPIKCREKNLQ